jgi:hypothetical protein
MDGEKDAQDVHERNRSRVERDLDGLRMARGVRTNGFVRRVREMTAGISDLHLLDPAEVLENRLQAPEAASRDGSDLA